MSDLPLLNLGCGRVILPGEQPWHHGLVEPGIYSYPYWHNVDRNATPGVDETWDLFLYPWPWADNSFGGALLSHLVEHVPHDIRINRDVRLAGDYWRGRAVEWHRRQAQLSALQDGWFAFFSELWRVLEPGAVAHVLCPHASSDGALADPTHTRYVMPHTFGYLKQDEGSPFEYSIGCDWRTLNQSYRVTEMYEHLLAAEGDDDATLAQKGAALRLAMMVQRNVAYEFYTQLEAVK